MRRLNLVFLAIALSTVAVLGGGMHLVHGVQVRRNATALFGRFERAQAGNDLEKAEQSLSQYLSLRRDDGSAWKRFAQLVKQRDPDRRNRERVFLIHEEALRYNSGDTELERKCADLALELQRYGDAQRHLTKLLENATKDSQGQPTAAELAELEDLLGQCDRGLIRYKDAEKSFRKALEHDPSRVSCYDQLARLLRTNLRRNEDADDTITKMVAKNPAAGRAYIYRWRYKREFALSPDADDLQKALELAPNDLEVLFTSAVVSEQEQDLASARVCYQQGIKLDPKITAFSLNLAQLEIRDGHIEQAESILRQADQANPSLEVAFQLAATLIAQNKIDDNDPAASYVARLRDAGLGDNLVRYLDAQRLCRRKKWAEAIPQIEMARAVLKSFPWLAAPLNLMLAECYSHVGSDEQRLNALRQVTEGGQGSESVRIEFGRALARAGKLDQAIAVLSPLVQGKPELRVDLVTYLIQKASRPPRDPRSWLDVERELRAAEKALPDAVEPLTFLKVDLLAAQDRLEDARLLLASVLAKDSRNIRYRLALARLTQRQGKGPAALQILDQAEKDLGPSLDIQLARLDYWGLEGGNTARAAVARLAETRQQFPAVDRPAFLDRLAMTEIRLRELALARQYFREQAAVEPDNLRVRLSLFDLAVEAGEQEDAADLVSQIRTIESDKGSYWRFAQAALVIEKDRRKTSRDLEGARAPAKVSHDLEEARVLAAEISERQPEWWGGPTLKGRLAELEVSPDQAIEYWLRAVELGNVQPSFVRRLVGLLYQRNRFTEIDHLAQVLRDQGVAVNEITIIKAIDAIRKQDFDGALALAREIYSETSTNPSDHLMLGRFYMSAGQSDMAGKEFRRAVELGPGVPDSWLIYVQYLVQTKHIDQAKSVVEAARKALPADRATLTLAECCLIVGDMEQAESLIQRLLKDKPQDLATLRLAAGLYSGQNRVDKADEYLDKLDHAASSSPDDKAWANRIRTALRLKTGRLADRDQALGLVERNLKSKPDSVEDQLLKATILAVRPGPHGESVKILEQLDGANRLEPSQRFLLAQLYLGDRNEEKYQSEMLKLLAVKAKNPQHLAHFVNYSIGRNQLDQADRWLAELKKVEPQGVAALELEARLLDVRKRKPELLALLKARGRIPDQIGPVADLLNRFGFAKEAEAAYKTFVARDLKQPERALVLANFLARQARHPEAMEIFRDAWRKCPHEAVALSAVAIYESPSAAEPQKREVVKWLIQAARERPDDADLATKLGFIFCHEGRFDEAELLNRQVLARNPQNATALNNLANLLALHHSDKTSEALRLISRAIEVHGAHPSLLDTRAVVMIRAGRSEQAIKDLRDACDRNPRSVNYALHLAWAYQAVGRIDDARGCFRTAEELGFKVDENDTLQRPFMVKLRRDLSATELTTPVDRKS